MDILNVIYKFIMRRQVIGTIITLGAAWVIVQLFNKLISRLLISGKDDFEVKRRKTIIRLIQSIFRYIVYIIALLIILDFFGIDTKSLITSLGIAGVVLGLALQDTVKDLISGIFLVLENYLQVGDIVTYQDFTGEVVELGLRTTKIKAFDGQVLIVANRNIDTIINASQKKANLLIEIATGYEEETEKVEEVLKQVIEEAKKDKLIFSESEYLGINDLGAHSVQYLIKIKCNQNDRYTIRREMLRRIKLAYEASNLKIPYNQIEVHHGKDI